MPDLDLFLSHPYEDDEEVGADLKSLKRSPDTTDQAKYHRYVDILWWKQKVADEYVFNNRKELVDYCCNDVALLCQGSTQFRKYYMEATLSDRWESLKFPKGYGVDPFAYPTIASASMAAFLHAHLERDVLAYIPRYRIPKLHAAIRWLDFRSRYEQRKIRHARNSSQKFKIGYVEITGISEDKNTVYFYHECAEDGCKKCYPKREFDLQKTKKRVQFVRRKGFAVIQIWHCDFQDLSRKNDFYREFEQLYLQESSQPLYVRDAFYGGRTNACRLHYKCDPEEKETIRYVDYCSLYPDVNKNSEYPIKHPVIRLDCTPDDVRLSRLFGIVKCRVLPPKGLRHPVLPMRINGKLMFALCRVCAKECSPMCTHSDDARSFVGTWCTPELEKAVEIGYEIMEVYEAHHFHERQIGLFAGYIDAFMKLKQQASGWPQEDMSNEAKQRYIEQCERINGYRLDAEKIENNKGKRKTYKAGANSLWGKTAQNGNMTRSKMCMNADQFWGVVLRDFVEVQSVFVHPVNTSSIEVLYKEEDSYWKEPRNTNVYVAAFTTCWARLKLWSLLQKLDQDVLYYDTDSVIYIHRPLSTPEIPLGQFLGELTDELAPDGSVYITEFVSTGPKSYAYRTSEGHVICKFKGLSKTLYNLKYVNFESMLSCIQKGTVYSITGAKNLIFKLNKYGHVQTLRQSKIFRMVYDKRWIGDQYITFPFGYVDGAR